MEFQVAEVKAAGPWRRCGGQRSFPIPYWHFGRFDGSQLLLLSAVAFQILHYSSSFLFQTLQRCLHQLLVGQLDAFAVQELVGS